MKKGILILLALSLGACSFGSLVYNNFHHAVLWKASDYIDLEKSQKKLLRQTSIDFITWHKQGELGQYKVLLQELYSDLQRQTLTLEKAQTYRVRTQQFAENIIEYLKPQLPILLSTLTTEQYEELISNISKKIDKREQKTTSERVDERLERMEEWYGKLNSQQEIAVIDWEKQRTVRDSELTIIRAEWLIALEKSSAENINRHVNFNDALWSILDYFPSPSQEKNNNIATTVWFLSEESQQKKVLAKIEDIQTSIDSILDAS